MNSKKLLSILFIIISISIFAEESATKVKLYGFIGNDFSFNSRQNVELVDGLVQLFPKPVLLNSVNKDINATPQAELLSVNTRLGIDISGTTLFGAKSAGKIEADFAGFGTTFYVFRIRQAYMKLNWLKTELLVGQTWHPLFGNVSPTTFSINGGAPFQPFNRSPQIRFKYNLSNTLTLTAATIYEMQYTSNGPSGLSNVYLKNAMMPDVFLGLENKTTHWTTGVGVDVKTIKPTIENLTSASAVAYVNYTVDKFQLKAKAIYGENLTDQLMLGGYGVSGITDSISKNPTYTNFNNVTSWINAVYGTKWQVGVLVGLVQNLGTNHDLMATAGKFTFYGWGCNTDQQMIDRLIRVAPQVSYNLPNMKLGLELDITSAEYGILKSNGRVSNPYNVTNNRILASVSYLF